MAGASEKVVNSGEIGNFGGSGEPFKWQEKDGGWEIATPLVRVGNRGDSVYVLYGGTGTREAGRAVVVSTHHLGVVVGPQELMQRRIDKSGNLVSMATGIINDPRLNMISVGELRGKPRNTQNLVFRAVSHASSVVGSSERQDTLGTDHRQRILEKLNAMLPLVTPK